jgi:hypothetical protein
MKRLRKLIQYVEELKFETNNTVVHILLVASSASALDPNPHGSALILVGWILFKNTHKKNQIEEMLSFVILDFLF